MRERLRPLRYWFSIGGALACLVIALFLPAIPALVLLIVALGLLVDGGTGMFARAGGTGGVSNHRQ